MPEPVIGWDLGAPEGDQTVYCVRSQTRLVYIGPDGEYAKALCKQLAFNGRPSLQVIQGGRA